MVSTVKVTNIDTPDNTGNITFDRPIVGDGSSLTGVTDNASVAFQAYPTLNHPNAIGGGTVYNFTAIGWTERFDIGNNFNVSNGTFTAPSTGKYLLSAAIQVGGIDTAHTYFQAYIVTSNLTYRFDHADLDSGFAGTTQSSGTVTVDMDASDTAYLRYTLTGSTTGTANINGGQAGVMANTAFSGFLIG
jgi:hypothetical protein